MTRIPATTRKPSAANACLSSCASVQTEEASCHGVKELTPEVALRKTLLVNPYRAEVTSLHPLDYGKLKGFHICGCAI